MTEQERLCRVAVAMTEGIGPASCRDLIDAYGSAEAAIKATPKNVAERTRLKPDVAAGLRDSVELAEKEMANLEALGGWVLILDEESYPQYLTEIYGPPQVLFGIGSLEPDDSRAVAVVGSRRATDYGSRVTRRLAGELARFGVTVVSGLAVGIDTEAHAGALSAGGRTIAVLGAGLDVDYPKGNVKLKEEIAGQGAVLTEYPLGTQPKGWHFPVRNRIIAGLVQGVVVAEASPRSGSLITAKLALEFGRTVMAVPGPVSDRRREGTHELIRQGAVLVADGREVAAELWPYLMPGSAKGRGVDGRSEEAESELDPGTKNVYRLLEDSPRQVDDLIRQAELNAEEVLGRLLDLELRGLARRLPGQYFVKA